MPTTTLPKLSANPIRLELRVYGSPFGTRRKPRILKDPAKIQALLDKIKSATEPKPRVQPREKTSDEQGAYVEALKAAAGGAWSTAEFVEKAEISRQALKDRRDSFTIVYWTDAKGHCFYPKWQFDGSLRVLPAVRTLLGLLRTHDTLHVLTKFLVPAIGDKGESILDLIQSGRSEEAIAFLRAEQDEERPRNQAQAK